MSRFRVLAAGMTVTAVAILATASPASAHDELLSSTPEPGAALETAPESVSLTFSADVLDMGAVIIVADGDGRDWAAEESTVQSGVVSTALDADMPAAGYEVRWRVVSSDGHPISGVIPFTVGDASPLVRTAAPSATAGSLGGESTAADQNTTDGSGALRLVLLGATGAATAAAAFAAFLLLRRRRSSAPAGTDGSDS